jgi:hypothetical protein
MEGVPLKGSRARVAGLPGKFGLRAFVAVAQQAVQGDGRASGAASLATLGAP